MPPILDVAIGAVFVFLLFSIIVTALNEVVLSFFDKRADFMRLGLGELLNDPQEEKVRGYLAKLVPHRLLASIIAWAGGAILGIQAVPGFWWIAVAAVTALGIFLALRPHKKPSAGEQQNAKPKEAPPQGQEEGDPPSPINIDVDNVFKHPLIYSLSKGETDPSYIGSGPFAQAILDLLIPAIKDTTIGDLAKPNTDELKTAIGRVDNEKLRQSLASLLKQAKGDADDFKAAIEAWFNGTMERVTGWYKRHAQTWLLVLAFILAIVCNVDGIRIIQTLATNPNLAKSITAQAETYAKANKAPQTDAELKKAQEEKEKKIAAAREDLKKASPDQIAEKQKNFDEAIGWDASLATFRTDLKALGDTGLPMGWDPKSRQHFNIVGDHANAAVWQIWQWKSSDQWNWAHLFSALCGWALTALAASLGAPFWFDLLQRIMNLRANGRSPDEKPLGSKKDDSTSTAGR